VSKPVPKLLAAQTSVLELTSNTHLVLHASDPHATVGEGYLTNSAEDPGTTILEESLVCRMQLAGYYISYDEELGQSGERGEENQELRRARRCTSRWPARSPTSACCTQTCCRR